jgi:hypothetical protein
MIGIILKHCLVLGLVLVGLAWIFGIAVLMTEPSPTEVTVPIIDSPGESWLT